MEKVKLTKEQANALEILVNCHDKEICVIGRVDGIVHSEYKILNELTLDTFIKALYIGYEVELTPEEKILELYTNTKGNFENETLSEVTRLKCLYGMECIETVLNILKIEVKGINF